MAHIIKRSTKRGTSYDVVWRTGAVQRSHTEKDMERALLAQIAVERGDEPSRVLPDVTTLKDFWDAWQARWQIGRAPKTILVVNGAKQHLDALMQTHLRRLTVAEVEDLIAELAADKPRQAQLTLATLKKCLRAAQARDHKVDARILAIPSPAYDGKEIRFLTWDEVERLQSFVDPRVCRIVPVAALTGMRKGELYGLKDSQVHLDEGYVTLRVTKTRTSRKVWLSDKARLLLKEQLVVRTPSVHGLMFPTRTGHRLDSRFEATYREAVKHAGLEGANFHSLRHTCAALMIRAGCNAFEVAEQLGHMSRGKPDPTMVWKRYGWLFPGATQTAIKGLDRISEAKDEEADTA